MKKLIKNLLLILALTLSTSCNIFCMEQGDDDTPISIEEISDYDQFTSEWYVVTSANHFPILTHDISNNQYRLKICKKITNDDVEVMLYKEIEVKRGKSNVFNHEIRTLDGQLICNAIPPFYTENGLCNFFYDEKNNEIFSVSVPTNNPPSHDQLNDFNIDYNQPITMPLLKEDLENWEIKTAHSWQPLNNFSSTPSTLDKGDGNAFILIRRKGETTSRPAYTHNTEIFNSILNPNLAEPQPLPKPKQKTMSTPTVIVVAAALVAVMGMLVYRLKKKFNKKIKSKNIENFNAGLDYETSN